VINILLIVAGLCVIFGARGLAEKVLRTVAGLVLVVTLLPGVLLGLSGPTPFVLPAGRTVTMIVAAIVLCLVAIGAVAWRTRAYFARRRQEARGRSAAPRERALPAPPSKAEVEDS